MTTANCADSGANAEMYLMSPHNTVPPVPNKMAGRRPYVSRKYAAGKASYDPKVNNSDSRA
jgi:hypothetical protein